MNEEEIVLKRLKDTLAVLTGKNVITNLDFQIRNMVEDCIKVIEKQQEEIEKKDNIIDLMAKDILACGFDFIDFGIMNGDFKEDTKKVLKYYNQK